MLELRHVREVDDAVDDIRPVESGGLERAADAREDFGGLRLDVAFVRGGVAGDASDVYTIPDLNCGAQIRIRRTRRAIRVRRRDRLARRVLDRDHGDLHEVIRAAEAGLHRRARRRHRGEVRSIRGVHRLKGRFVGQKNAGRHDVRVAHVRRLQDCRAVVEDRLRLRRDVALDRRVVLAVAADEPREEERVARSDPVAVRVGRLDPVARVHDDTFASGGHGDHRDFDEAVGDGQRLGDDDRGPRRWIVRPVGGVHLVHAGEVARVAQVDHYARRIGEARAGGLERSADIVERLLCLRLDVPVRHRSRRRPDCAGDVNQPGGFDRAAERKVRVRAEGLLGLSVDHGCGGQQYTGDSEGAHLLLLENTAHSIRAAPSGRGASRTRRAALVRGVPPPAVPRRHPRAVDGRRRADSAGRTAPDTAARA